MQTHMNLSALGNHIIFMWNAQIQVTLGVASAALIYHGRGIFRRLIGVKAHLTPSAIEPERAVKHLPWGFSVSTKIKFQSSLTYL